MANTRDKQIPLPGGCTMSGIIVYPSNYKKSSKTISLKWYIKYRFYDPRFKEPKQVFLRGMNEISDHKARIAHTDRLIMQEMQQLLNGYNPFDVNRRELTVQSNSRFIIPKTKFRIIGDDSWEHAFLKAIPYLNKSKDLTELVIGHVKQALLSVEQLNMSNLPIRDVKAKELLLVFDHLSDTQAKWSQHLHNRYISHLGYIFTILNLQEANMHMPHKLIPRKVVPQRMAKVLETDEITRILNYAKEHHYRFYRFLYIFYYSGARPIELLRVRFEDVVIKDLVFKVNIRKGNQDVEEWKAIHQNTLSVWIELYNKAKAGDYIFGEDFVPGRFWNKKKPYQAPYRRIKSALGITKKMYSFKHHRMDAIEEYMCGDQGLELAMEVVKAFASHRSKRTGANYAIGRDARMMAVLRRVPSTI